MPALRHRPSRTSTPSNAPDTPAPSSDSKRQKTQGSLDSWIEPPIQKPTPSFEDHGFARHGVLQGMSPLGVGPSAKVKQRTRTFDGMPAARISFGRNGNLLAGEEGVSTPEMTPARELEQEDSEKQDDEEVMPVYQAQDEEEDDDYMPTKVKVKGPHAKTPVRGKTPVQSKASATGKTPVKNGVSRPSTAIDSPATQNILPTSTADLNMNASQQRLTIIVNEAVSRARQHGQTPIEIALRQMQEDTKGDANLYETMDSIIRQNATPQNMADFRRYIKDAKKRYRREERVKQAEATSAAASATPPVGTSESIVAQSKNDSDAIMDDAPPSHEGSTEVKADRRGKPHPLSTAPVIPPRHSHSPRPSRMPSKSPRKPRNANVSSPLVASSDADAGASTKAATPTANLPDSVIGSDSDLSEVNEDIVQSGSPEPAPVPTVLNAHGYEIVSGAPGKKGKQTHTGRIGKKSRANSAKPNGRPEKKQPPTAEEVAEDQDLQRKRQAMVDQQPLRTQGIEPAVSDMRFDDEMLETESLTESQIAVGPPIDSNRQRRPARAQRGTNTQLGKRLRDGSSRLPSPQPGSAATTRPSTPAAIVPPATKRLKLNNGQAARTKRSPVKNRDGPIAGIAHTGGGGSRQLGPDDNDPGSPPESDDFCAACKGAGEFVCCDTCPRVFHFVCCDPPRVEPPDGSFYCYECTSKLKQVEEPVVETFATLSPLFRQLDSTNARSFALPKEIQIFFDGVTARDDGSFYEEMKKFNLSKSSGYGYQKPDYLKTHDHEHNPILCVQCGKSSSGKRQMLKCDFCSAWWHLDCCDPPLANPPHISLEASTRDAWKCPRHVDHDLRSGLLVQQDLNAVHNDGDVEMADAAPAVRIPRKVRKPKKLSVVEPTFSRGMRNNGLIEIINDPDDDTDGEGNYVFDDQNSKSYRVPEKGIVLDFITKVKQNRREEQKAARRAAKLAARHRASQQQFAARPIQQQQAALHLAQLAKKEADIGLQNLSVDALVLGLTAEAPPEVVSAISNAGPEPMTDAKRAELLKLRALIDRALET